MLFYIQACNSLDLKDFHFQSKVYSESHNNVMQPTNFNIQLYILHALRDF